MTNKINPKVTPKELTPALIGPIAVTPHDSLLQDVNAYRQINKFLSEFPKGAPSRRLGLG